MKPARRKVYACVLTSSDGEVRCYILTKCQFDAMRNADDPWHWVTAGAGRRRKALERVTFDSIREFVEHIQVNAMEVVGEIIGVL